MALPDRLKITAVEAPVTPENERRTRNGKFTLRQLRQTDGIVPLQSGTNQFDSQKGKTGFGMPRNTATPVNFADRGKKWTIEELRASDAIVRLQSGTNRFESQKGMTGFGTPRDVKGKHLKRIWELEFPEEAIADEPIQRQEQEQQQQPQQQQQQPPQH
uniref:Calponin-homology (CH) domain-containing protein n=1 Tax=Syphacia muris TaxID=451379 RepID=A0A0N5AJ94_9BILA